MSSDFDAYQSWLDIPPAEQPPNHYRLLGIDLFEDDADTIVSAIKSRALAVRAYRQGEHALQSQQLLQEIAAARQCLCDPETKAGYDEVLRLQVQEVPNVQVQDVPEDFADVEAVTAAIQAEPPELPQPSAAASATGTSAVPPVPPADIVDAPPPRAAADDELQLEAIAEESPGIEIESFVGASRKNGGGAFERGRAAKPGKGPGILRNRLFIQAAMVLSGAATAVVLAVFILDVFNSGGKPDAAPTAGATGALDETVAGDQDGETTQQTQAATTGRPPRRVARPVAGIRIDDDSSAATGASSASGGEKEFNPFEQDAANAFEGRLEEARRKRAGGPPRPGPKPPAPKPPAAEPPVAEPIEEENPFELVIGEADVEQDADRDKADQNKADKDKQSAKDKDDAASAADDNPFEQADDAESEDDGAEANPFE